VWELPEPGPQFTQQTWFSGQSEESSQYASPDREYFDLISAVQALNWGSSFCSNMLPWPNDTLCEQADSSPYSQQTSLPTLHTFSRQEKVPGTKAR